MQWILLTFLVMLLVLAGFDRLWRSPSLVSYNDSWTAQGVIVAKETKNGMRWVRYRYTDRTGKGIEGGEEIRDTGVWKQLRNHQSVDIIYNAQHIDGLKLVRDRMLGKE